MGRKIEEFKETTVSRVYKIVNEFHVARICCVRCKRRTTRGYYSYSLDDAKWTKFPSWKLVSKNSKQWMDKEIKFKKTKHRRFEDYYEITW